MMLVSVDKRMWLQIFSKTMVHEKTKKYIYLTKKYLHKT